MDCGALDALVICLEEFDPGVKEAAAWALGYIARHNAGKYMKAELNYIMPSLFYWVISKGHEKMLFFYHKKIHNSEPQNFGTLNSLESQTLRLEI